MTTNEPTEAEIVPEQPALALEKHNPANAPAAKISPTQARVEAVADLIKVAMSKAGTLQLTPDESKKLLADFPDDDFQPGAGGKEHLLYVEHAALRDRLNSTLGLGQWAIIVRESWNEDFETKGNKDKPPQKGVRVYARAMLLVRGCYVAEAVGDMDYYPANASQNYGDAFEGAKTAAFRRCAKEFGVGLQAWRKGFGEGWKDRRFARMEAAQAEKSEPKAPAQPATTMPVKPLKERLAALSLWLQGQLGVDDYEWVVPFLRSHTPDGLEKSSALMPNEDLTALSDSMLDVIKSDPQGFLERIKAFAKANDSIPGAEAPKPIEVPRDANPDHHSPDALWRRFPMPFGASKGVALAELDKKYLFGLWANYTVETEYNGRAKKPETVSKETLFRKMLDEAGKHYEFTKKD